MKGKSARQGADIFLILTTAVAAGEGDAPAAHRQYERENQPRIKQRIEA